MSVSRHIEQDNSSDAGRFVEAARYALLRRLAPAIRHNMAGGLQPISMIAAMLEKRLQSPAPDLAMVAKNAIAMNALSREAAASCIDLMTWLAPKGNAVVPLNAGVADAIGLITTDLSFRGFTVVNETAEAATPVLRDVLRNVMMAGVIALTDSFEAPANVVMTTALDADGANCVFEVRVVMSQSDMMSSSGTSAYRNLEWSDVEALAHAESVALEYTSDSLQLSFKVQQLQV